MSLARFGLSEADCLSDADRLSWFLRIFGAFLFGNSREGDHWCGLTSFLAVLLNSFVNFN